MYKRQPLADDVHRLAVRQGGFVDALADQRVVDVGDRHQPRGERDGLAVEALRIARSVPTPMMRIDDLRGAAQEFVVRIDTPFGGAQRVAAKRRVRSV